MKIPKPKKMATGGYRIQLRLGGVSVPVTAETEKECVRKAEVIKAEHRAAEGSVQLSKTNKTLRAAIDDYIASRTQVLSPSTIRGYRTVQRSYLQSVMDLKLRDIKGWQKIIDAECARLSAKTIKNTWRFVCSVLRDNDIEPPKIKLPQVIAAERPWLEPEQIPVFVSAIKETPQEIPALLALHSLRRSEIMGLTWDNIDLKRKIIKVAGSAVFDGNQKLVQKQTNKNESSRRNIPIMIPALYDALLKVENKAGNVVTCNPNTIWAQVNRTCRSLGFPEVGVHGLRHSFASLAYHLGLSERETMELGGWSDISTMQRIYTHIAQKDRLAAKNKLAAFFEQNS